MSLKSVFVALIFSICTNLVISSSNTNPSAFQVPKSNIALKSRDNKAEPFGPWMDHDEYNMASARTDRRPGVVLNSRSPSPDSLDIDDLMKPGFKELKAKNVLHHIASSNSIGSTGSSSGTYSPLARAAIFNSMKDFEEFVVDSASAPSPPAAESEDVESDFMKFETFDILDELMTSAASVSENLKKNKST